MRFARSHFQSPTIGRRFFSFKCKIGYEYHRRSHGTGMLSPGRKNPGTETEERERERERNEEGHCRRMEERGSRVSRRRRRHCCRVVWQRRRGVYRGSSGKVGENAESRPRKVLQRQQHHISLSLSLSPPLLLLRLLLPPIQRRCAAVTSRSLFLLPAPLSGRHRRRRPCSVESYPGVSSSSSLPPSLAYGSAWPRWGWKG